MAPVTNRNWPDYRLNTPEPVYYCRTCKDVEYVPVIINGVEYMQRCQDCYSRRQAERLQKICGLNEQERQVSLFSIAPNGNATTTMVNAAQDFIAQPKAMLTLYGTCGNAKTLVLQSIVNAMLAQGIGAIYTTFFDLVEWVREAYSDRERLNDSAWNRVKRLQDIRVLCVDELDKVKQTEWVHMVETELIDTRYRNGIAGICGTVLAMNGTLDQLSDHLQSRLLDGRNKVTQNNDPDMRKVMR